MLTKLPNGKTMKFTKFTTIVCLVLIGYCLFFQYLVYIKTLDEPKSPITTYTIIDTETGEKHEMQVYIGKDVIMIRPKDYTSLAKFPYPIAVLRKNGETHVFVYNVNQNLMTIQVD